MKESILNKFKADLQDKKIAIWGFGKEGTSTLHFIQNNNIKCKELAILDTRDIDIDGIKKLNDVNELNEYDLIFKSPGIVVDDNVNKEKLTSQTEEFIKILSKQIIGITGTKGKSTTTTLTYTILKKYFPNTVLVGNIGIPCFNAINEIDENTNIVFELSCHQLEFVKYSPHIAVILNFYQEHLDHYKTFENYIKAKLNINKFQKPDDIFIFGENCKPYINSKTKNNICINDYIDGRTITINNDKIEIHKDDTHLIGEHNLFDIAISYYICREIYKISNEDFKSALKQFKGLPHRLEYVTTKDDVLYYDDSVSTIGETTIEALKALKNVNTLILGGMDRKIDYSNLEDFILQQESLENIILMYDTGKRIFSELQNKNEIKKNNELQDKNETKKNKELQNKNELQNDKKNQNNNKSNNKKNCYLVEDLEEAVKKAKEVTKKNTICLLSPAAASYGFFKNFEERGDKFKEYVFEL